MCTDRERARERERGHINRCAHVPQSLDDYEFVYRCVYTHIWLCPSVHIHAYNIYIYIYICNYMYIYICVCLFILERDREISAIVELHQGRRELNKPEPHCQTLVIWVRIPHNST